MAVWKLNEGPHKRGHGVPEVCRITMAQVEMLLLFAFDYYELATWLARHRGLGRGHSSPDDIITIIPQPSVGVEKNRSRREGGRKETSAQGREWEEAGTNIRTESV